MTTPDNDRPATARTTDVGEGRPIYADERDRTAGVGEAGLGEADPTYANEADRTAYGNSDRLEDNDRTMADSTGDALDRPADALDGQRAPVDDSAPEVNPEDPLVPDDIAVDFKARWDVIQQGFVDDPRNAVTDADKLVGDVLQRLSATFDQQHQSLEGQWANGEPSTEDLRGALQRYRAFFDRLVSL
jgi:hypothetical protein